MIYSRLAAPNTYTFAFPLRTVIRAGIDFRECGAQFYATANGRERRAPAGTRPSRCHHILFIKRYLQGNLYRLFTPLL